jgi:hypothetical protein
VPVCVLVRVCVISPFECPPVGRFRTYFLSVCVCVCVSRSYVILMSLLTDKARAKGEEGRRRWCYERQGAKD